MITQIYDVINTEDAYIVSKAGADHIGLWYGEDNRAAGLPLPDSQLAFDLAKEIFAAIPQHVKKVGLSMSDKMDVIIETVKTLKPDILHLGCDPNLMPPENLSILRTTFPDVLLMQGVYVVGKDSVSMATRYDDVADYILLDTISDAQLGGTGVVHDWNISREIVQKSRLPVILAGGLSSENVAEAIRLVKPWGVDCLSHTNRTEPPYGKDPEKVRKFIAAARGATKYLYT